MDSQELEEINTDLIKLKDLLWHIEYDRIIVSQSVGELLGGRTGIGLLKSPYCTTSSDRTRQA